MAKQAPSVKRSLSIGGWIPTYQAPGVVRLDWILEGASRAKAHSHDENEAYAERLEARYQQRRRQRAWVIARVGEDATTDEWVAAFKESDLIFFPCNPHDED